MRSITLLSVLLIAGMLYGCGGGGSSGTVATLVTPSYSKQMVVSVTDAKTGLPVVANVAVSGATVYGSNGFPFTAAATNAGGSLNVNLLGSGAATLTFTVSAGDYITSIYKLSVESGVVTGQIPVAIAMVSVDPAQAPNGVGSGLTTNTTTANLKVTAKDAASGATTDVIIPAGAVVSAGTTPLTGPLTLTSSVFNPIGYVGPEVDVDGNFLVSPSALDLFPGGFSNVTVDGTPMSFVTTGFTDISVKDAAGKAATTLDKPMTVRMYIAAGALKPDGTPVQENDRVPVWTYKTSTGTWIAEPSSDPAGEIVYLDTTNNSLYVEFKPNHFSNWNLGYSGSTCSGTLTLGSANNIDHKYGLTFRAQSNLGWSATAVKPPGETTVSLTGVPTNVMLTIYAYYGSAPVVAGTTSVGKNCAISNPLTVVFPSASVTTKPYNHYTWKAQRMCKYPPYNTQPIVGATAWICQYGTTTFAQASGTFPSRGCRVSTVTAADGTANVASTDTNVFFFQPTGLAMKGPYKATDLPATVTYVGNWNYCPNTGAGGGTPLGDQ